MATKNGEKHIEKHGLPWPWHVFFGQFWSTLAVKMLSHNSFPVNLPKRCASSISPWTMGATQYLNRQLGLDCCGAIGRILRLSDLDTWPPPQNQTHVFDKTGAHIHCAALLKVVKAHGPEAESSQQPFRTFVELGYLWRSFLSALPFDIFWFFLILLVFRLEYLLIFCITTGSCANFFWGQHLAGPSGLARSNLVPEEK